MAKMHPIRFRLGSAPDPAGGAYSAPPDPTASELILEWGGVEEARPEDGVLGEGTASHSPPTRGFAGAL